MTDDATLGALQNALDTEHRAVYGYGLVGGRVTGVALTDAQSALVVHANRRDAITRLIRAAGATPVAAQPGYRSRHAVITPRSAYALAVDLEDACAAAYAVVIGATRPHALRSSAIGWLRDSAVRATRWRVRGGTGSVAAAPPLPGLDVTRADTVRPTSTGGPTP